MLLKFFREHFESNNFLLNSQHGYRAGRSTTSALHRLTDCLEQKKNAGYFTGTAFVDLSSAFDCVDHQTLLEKLKLFGLDSKSRQWIKDFLTNRKQIVQVNGAYSEKLILLWGVPQGSCLSPLLYIIYIADIDYLFKNVTLLGFADDYNLSISDKDPKIVIEKCESALNVLTNYYSRNGLVMNPQKTEFLMVRPKKSRDEFYFQVNGISIKESQEVRVLGLMLTNKLCWKKHLNNVIKTVSIRIGLLSRLRFKLSSAQLTSIVHGIILSHIKYGLSVYTSIRLEDQDSRNSQLDKLQILLNNSARLIHNINRTDRISINELHKLSPWLSLNQMCVESVALETWKARSCFDMSENYNSAYTRNTRAATDQVIKEKVNASEFVRNGIKILNDKRFQSVKYLHDLTDVRKHIKKCITSIPF